MIVIAAFALNLAQPGPVFSSSKNIVDVEVTETK